MASTAALASIWKELKYLATGIGKVILVVYVPLVTTMVLLHFPYDVDAGPQVQAASIETSAAYYEVAYRPPQPGEKRGLDYETVAAAAAQSEGIESKVRKFARDFGLENKKVLEVGSGRGYLQDVVRDYTGLDISPSVQKHYHKPFVAASATDMPFPDSSFDAVWTIWVLEHIPQPEKTFREIRRVLRPGGVAYISPAWNCNPWAAHGLDVRPYSDFNWKGKLLKASVPVRASGYFQMLYMMPTRAIRYAQYEMGGPNTRLRFRALQPNYEIYWEPDSDAVVSLDSFETYLWFRSQGDKCRNCGDVLDEMSELRTPLIIEVRK